MLAGDAVGHRVERDDVVAGRDLHGAEVVVVDDVAAGEPGMRFCPKPSTGQLTTVAVGAIVTSPAAAAFLTASAEVSVRGDWPATQCHLVHEPERV